MGSVPDVPAKQLLTNQPDIVVIDEVGSRDLCDNPSWK